MKWAQRIGHQVRHYTDKSWYPQLLGAIAFLDSVLLVIPVDGMLLSSILANPKRWKQLSLWTAIGTSLGAILFTAAIEIYGIGLIQHFAPELLQNTMWGYSERWFNQYGIFAVFGFASLPLIYHPVLTLAGIAKMNLFEVGLAMILGRFVKYGLYSLLAIHSPKLFMKFSRVNRRVDDEKMSDNKDE